jgi:hypothetical protein
VSNRTEVESDRTYSFLEISDEIVPVLFLLQTSERHFRARNILRDEIMSETPFNRAGHDTRTFLGFSRYSKSVLSSH